MSDGDASALIFVTGMSGGGIREPGLCMAVSRSGRSIGFVSNGCLEADILRAAAIAMERGRALARSYGPDGGPIDIRLPCGGTIDILIVPVNASHLPCLEMIAAVHRSPANILLTQRGELSWTRGDAADAPGAWQFMIQPRIRLVVVGSGYEALCLARLASQADMDVEILTPHGMNHADRLEPAIPYKELKGLSSPIPLSLDRRSAVALMLHDRDWELKLIASILRSEVLYLGALGSMKTHRERCTALYAMGFTDNEIDRIRAPIGLVQKLRDPNQIAISVLAEIIATSGDHGNGPTANPVAA